MMLDAWRRSDDPGINGLALDARLLSASNAIDVPISRRRSARHERHFRWCVRCLFIAMAIAIAVRILLG
jgi:hypothetical protein